MPKYENDSYDIGKAFATIEEELIASMIRNMRRHKLEEIDEDKMWSMWQVEQLKYLEEYKRRNKKKYGQQFKDINQQIQTMIQAARDEGGMEQEIAILKAIKKGFMGKQTSGMMGEFFHINDRKLDALLKATMNDMERAETAVLRMANDKYRKIIFNAQVYANTGAGTYEKAVDMATKDLLSAGLNCIEYANGARHTLHDYVDMAIRTASKRAYLQGEGEMRNEWGIHTVIMNKRGNPCPKCLPFCGKVLIDDVWSGGSRKDGPYPLMSTAISAGLYHPRCKDIHTTYFPGISTADDTWTKEELDNVEKYAKKEAKRQYASRQAEKYGRLAKYSLDKENREEYARKEKEWKEVVEKNENSDKIKLGVGSSDEMGKSFKHELGKISPENTEELISELSEQIRYSKVENAIVIDKEGNVVHYESATHDSVELFDIDFDGATVIHNHPEANGSVSFGEDDFTFLRENQKVKSLRCYNSKYDYYVEVITDISKLSYNDLWVEAIKTFDQYNDDDMQHIVFDILKRKGYVNYERSSVKRS